MTCAVNVGKAETTAGEMKQRQPIRKMSERRLKELSGNGISLHHNSTIRRKPCRKKSNDVTIVDRNYAEAGNTQGDIPIPNITDSISAHHCLKPAVTHSQSNFGKQRKPVNKQSAKQKERLQKLAAVRLKWWKEAQSHGKTLICGICDEPIWTLEDLASDHIIPGNPRDDSESNLQPANQLCNLLKGSQRNFKIVRGDRNWKLIHGML